MKTSVLTLAAALLGTMALIQPVQAQQFDFEIEGDGELEVNWDLDYEETELATDITGGEFSFNGGAGTEGDANAYGDVALTGGLSSQSASGDGDAWDYNGTNYGANATYGSTAFMTTGALAGDIAIDDWSRVRMDGLATAGGAGGVMTGRTSGTRYELTQDGSLNADYDIDADLEVNF